MASQRSRLKTSTSGRDLILRTASGHNRFAFDTSVPVPRPSQWGGVLSHTGKRITLADAVSLPAFLRGTRLICETAAGFPIELYRGYGANRRPVERDPRLDLLRRPNMDQTPFNVWSYVF